MGAAEIISFEEVRARKQWEALRQELHTRFDEWLAGLEALRQALTGGLTKTIVEHAHRGEAHVEFQGRNGSSLA